MSAISRVVVGDERHDWHLHVVPHLLLALALLVAGGYVLFDDAYNPIALRVVTVVVAATWAIAIGITVGGPGGSRDRLTALLLPSRRSIVGGRLLVALVASLAGALIATIVCWGIALLMAALLGVERSGGVGDAAASLPAAVLLAVTLGPLCAALTIIAGGRMWPAAGAAAILAALGVAQVVTSTGREQGVVRDRLDTLIAISGKGETSTATWLTLLALVVAALAAAVLAWRLFERRNLQAKGHVA